MTIQRPSEPVMGVSILLLTAAATALLIFACGCSQSPAASRPSSSVVNIFCGDKSFTPEQWNKLHTEPPRDNFGRVFGE